MNNNPNSKSKYKRSFEIALLFILAVVALYFIAMHQEHLAAYSSTIFFVIFVLMHFFMHRGHGRHGGHGRRYEGQHEHNEPAEKHDIDKTREPHNVNHPEHSPDDNKL